MWIRLFFHELNCGICSIFHVHFFSFSCYPACTLSLHPFLHPIISILLSTHFSFSPSPSLHILWSVWCWKSISGPCTCKVRALLLSYWAMSVIFLLMPYIISKHQQHKQNLFNNDIYCVNDGKQSLFGGRKKALRSLRMPTIAICSKKSTQSQAWKGCWTTLEQ